MKTDLNSETKQDLNQFFLDLVALLKIDKKENLNDLLIRTLAILLNESENEIRKNPANMQMRMLKKIEVGTKKIINSSHTSQQDTNAVYEEITFWKDKLKLLNVKEDNYTSIFDQLQQLLHDTQEKKLKSIVDSLKALSQNLVEKDPDDIKKILSHLKEQLSITQYKEIEKIFNNSYPNNISSIINEISEKLIQDETQVNLDEVVKIFESNFYNFEPGKEKEKNFAKKAEYDELAKNSIRKSMKSQGFTPLN